MESGQSGLITDAIRHEPDHTTFGPSVDALIADARAGDRFLNGLDHPMARDVATYWIGKVSAAGARPTREDFAPSKVAPWAPNLTFFRRAGTRDWQFTYCGMTVVRFFGTDPTGQLLSAVTGGETADIWDRNIARMFRENRPYLEQYKLHFNDRPNQQIRELCMPLRPTDGKGPEQFFSLLLATEG